MTKMLRNTLMKAHLRSGGQGYNDALAYRSRHLFWKLYWVTPGPNFSRWPPDDNCKHLFGPFWWERHWDGE